jgi:hypothetical protein
MREFQARALREMHAAGILCGEEYSALRGAVTTAGTSERSWLSAKVGERRWLAWIEDLGGAGAEARATRVLGFGYVLADFAIAPLQLEEHERQAVCRVAALGQLIAGAYDYVMDAGPGWRRIFLPRLALETDSVARLLRWLLARIGPRVSRITGRLVDLYFSELDRLPVKAGREHVRRSIAKVLVEMYKAERASLRGARLSAQEFRRKGALPFVLMGLTGWLVAPALEPQRYLRHLLWLHRLGDFFAWVDDIVDLEADAAARQPNRLLSGACEDEAALARAVAQKGRRVMLEWQQACNGSVAPTALRESALQLCVVSWFGGEQALAEYRSLAAGQAGN